MSSTTTARRLPLSRVLLGAAFPGLLVLGAVEEEEPVELGSGEHRYAWDESFGVLPDGAALGNTHGCVVVDARDRIYVNTDTEAAVLVFEPDGTLVDRWGAELAGGLHGMCIVERDGEERIYLAHIGRHEVFEASLTGEILRTLPWPEGSGLYESQSQYRPTSVAVAPNGDLFVADGYGLSVVHHYSAEGEYLATFGGGGDEPGRFRTPHGLILDARSDEPGLLIADRENGRLQLTDLAGTSRRIVEGMLRRPCHAQLAPDGSGHVVVADLAGRVTILDEEDQLLTHLGDNPDPAKRARNDVPAADCRPGEFVSPHCAAWDSAGNLYVADWLAFGRVTKLRRLP